MKKKILIIALLSLVSSQAVVFAQEKKERIVSTEETAVPELNVLNNVLYVKNAPKGSRIEVLTIVGNKVRIYENKTGDTAYELNLPRAIYIFKMEGIVRKFVVK